MRRLAPSSSTAIDRSSPRTSSTSASRPGCNAVAGPVFGRSRRADEGPRISHLDRDRALVDVEGGVATRDEAAAAWRAVGRLRGDRRQALILRFVDEMSTAEIAGVLGRSEGAVRVLVHRALRAVARDLAHDSGRDTGR